MKCVVVLKARFLLVVEGYNMSYLALIKANNKHNSVLKHIIFIHILVVRHKYLIRGLLSKLMLIGLGYSYFEVQSARPSRVIPGV